MEFTKFTSLINTYKQAELNRVYEQGIEDGPWLVLEKIDGANFSFWWDGVSKELRVASRNQWVDGSFYNCQVVLDKYEEGVRAALEVLFPEDQVTLYGELYGEGVLNRVSYGQKDFRLFAVCKDGYMLPWDIVELVAAGALLHTPPFLAQFSSFSDAVDYSEEFDSRLYDGVGPNKEAEGIVIMPKYPKKFHNGKQVLFKKKSEAFSEKKNKTKTLVDRSLSGADQALVDEILTGNTESRVLSVLSKTGQLSNFGKLLGMVVQDMLADSGKDLKGEAENYKNCSSTINKEVSKVVRPVFVSQLP